MVNFGKMMARKEREGYRIGEAEQLNESRGNYPGRNNRFKFFTLTLTAFTLILLVAVSEAKSVEPVVVWDKTYGGSGDDEARSIIETSDGYIVAGYTESQGAGDWDVWIIKLDRDGNIVWDKTYGGGYDDWANSIIETSDGYYVVAGATYSVNYSIKNLYADFWIIKLDNKGNIIWNKTFGKKYWDEANSIIETSDGYYVVAGATFSDDNGWDFWVIKLDKNGSVIWSRTFGDQWNQEAYSIIETSDGYVVAGYTTVETGIEKFWVIKLDKNGNLVWDKIYDEGEGRAYSIIETIDGYVVAGWTWKNDFGFGFRIIKIDKIGSIIWDKVFYELKSWIPFITRVSNNYFASVIFGSDIRMVKLDKNGQIVWSKTLCSQCTPDITDPSFIRLALVFTSEKHYVVAGGRDGNVWVIKLKEQTTESIAPVESETSIIPTTYKHTPQTLQTQERDVTSQLILALLILLAIPAIVLVRRRGKRDEREIKPYRRLGRGKSDKIAPDKPTKPDRPDKLDKLDKPITSGRPDRPDKQTTHDEPKTESTQSIPPTPPAPSLLPDFPHQLLTKYQPLEYLGEGGFAKVFKVKRLNDGKTIALKIPNLDKKARKFFLKEVRAWSQLNHPNIVKLFNAFDSPIPHLEMEYVEGIVMNGETIRDLSQYPKPVGDDVAIQLITKIADGLKHAHSKQIYHRDLKPNNILLKSDLTPKITDWGLAKIGAMTTTATTTKGLTLLYAAPEQLDDEMYGHTDQRTDVYQLGLVLYELLTDKLPYEGSSTAVIMAKIINPDVKPKLPSAHNEKLSKYDNFFEKVLAKRKEDRYQSVDEFVQALNEIEKLDKERRKLKESIAKTKTTMSLTTSSEELRKLTREVVRQLCKNALINAKLNDKAELIIALEELKAFSKKHKDELEKLVERVELMVRERIPVGEELISGLKVLLHKIEKEVGQ